MTSTNDSSGAMPTDVAKPNWTWLQEKIDQKNGAAQAERSAAAELGEWFDRQLAELEATFAEFVTPKSLTRDLKRSR